MVDDGLREAQFTGGGLVTDFLANFDDVESVNAAAVLKDDGVCQAHAGPPKQG
jgi:hypothetical protein